MEIFMKELSKTDLKMEFEMFCRTVDPNYVYFFEYLKSEIKDDMVNELFDAERRELMFKKYQFLNRLESTIASYK